MKKFSIFDDVTIHSYGYPRMQGRLLFYMGNGWWGVEIDNVHVRSKRNQSNQFTVHEDTLLDPTINFRLNDSVSWVDQHHGLNVGIITEMPFGVYKIENGTLPYYIPRSHAFTLRRQKTIESSDMVIDASKIVYDELEKLESSRIENTKLRNELKVIQLEMKKLQKRITDVLN